MRFGKNEIKKIKEYVGKSVVIYELEDGDGFISLDDINYIISKLIKQIYDKEKEIEMLHDPEDPYDYYGVSKKDFL